MIRATWDRLRLAAFGALLLATLAARVVRDAGHLDIPDHPRRYGR